MEEKKVIATTISETTATKHLKSFEHDAKIGALLHWAAKHNASKVTIEYEAD